MTKIKKIALAFSLLLPVKAFANKANFASTFISYIGETLSDSNKNLTKFIKAHPKASVVGSLVFGGVAGFATSKKDKIKKLLKDTKEIIYNKCSVLKEKSQNFSKAKKKEFKKIAAVTGVAAAAGITLVLAYRNNYLKNITNLFTKSENAPTEQLINQDDNLN